MNVALQRPLADRKALWRPLAGVCTCCQSQNLWPPLAFGARPRTDILIPCLGRHVCFAGVWSRGCATCSRVKSGCMNAEHAQAPVQSPTLKTWMALLYSVHNAVCVPPCLWGIPRWNGVWSGDGPRHSLT